MELGCDQQKLGRRKQRRNEKLRKKRALPVRTLDDHKIETWQRKEETEA